LFKKKEEGGDDYRSKKIHVRSKDPSRIARQFEKGIDNSSKSKGKGVSRCMLHPLCISKIKAQRPVSSEKFPDCTSENYSC
jgi:hypothetical protein